MLKAKKKYSKRELKQDKFILATIKVKEYLETNLKMISYGVIVVVAIVVAAVFIANSKRAAEVDAAELLTEAQIQINSGKREKGMDMLDQLIEEFDGTVAAGKGVFALASIYWKDGDTAQAKYYFKMYLDDYSSDNLITQAALAAYGDCLFNEKNYREAARYYEKAADLDPDFPQAVAYIYSAAQAYRDAGNTGKAKELSQKVINDYDNTVYKNRAEILLKSLSL